MLTDFQNFGEDMDKSLRFTFWGTLYILLQLVKVVMQYPWQTAVIGLLLGVGYDTGSCNEDALKLVCDWTWWLDEQTAAVGLA